MIAKTVNINEDERLRKWTSDEEKRTRSNSIISSRNIRPITGTPSYKSSKEIIPIQSKPKVKYLSKREYEQILKGAISDLKNNSGLDVENEDEFDYYSLMDDMADSMLYDEDLYNYLRRKYKRDYQFNKEPRRSELKEILLNDLSSF